MSSNAVYAGELPKTTGPAVRLPEVQTQYDALVQSFQNLREQIDMLDEQLGYISLPSCPETGSASDQSEPNRSPMAHNLYCAVSDANRLTSRIASMRSRLEI